MRSCKRSRKPKLASTTDMHVCICLFDHIHAFSGLMGWLTFCQERLSTELKKEREQHREEKAKPPGPAASQTCAPNRRSTFGQSSRPAECALGASWSEHG